MPEVVPAGAVTSTPPPRARRKTRTPARRAPPPSRRKHAGRRSQGRTHPQVRRERKRTPRAQGLDEPLDHPTPLPRSSLLSSPIPLRAAPRPLHILMVGWEWPPLHTGGLGVHCFELAKELTRLGHRITFLTPFTGPFTPVDGVRIRYPGAPEQGAQPALPTAYWVGDAPGSPFWNATDGYNAWVAQLGGVEDVDVVHVHDWFGTEGGIALARRIRPTSRNDGTLHRVRPLVGTSLGAHPRPRANGD